MPRARNCVGSMLLHRSLVVHVKPPTLDGHKFLVRTPICMFLDSLSLEFIHI